MSRDDSTQTHFTDGRGGAGTRDTRSANLRGCELRAAWVQGHHNPVSVRQWGSLASLHLSRGSGGHFGASCWGKVWPCCLTSSLQSARLPVAEQVMITGSPDNTRAVAT